MLPILYRALTRLLAPLAIAYLRLRRKRGKEHPTRLHERLGVPSKPRPSGPVVWMHAASVGEATAILGLIERLRQSWPLVEILVTTGTVSSAQLLEERLPAGARHQFVPGDLPHWVARFLDHWRPDLALWVESELWPNLALGTHAHGIPMVLLNGRLSARSYNRWRHWQGLIGPMLGAFRICLAQDEEQAKRLRSLGAAEVIAVGDLKAAAVVLPFVSSELLQLRCWLGPRPVWLTASTHAGEEEIVIQAHRLIAANHPGLLTIIVPRHPGRGDAIAAMLASEGLRVARRARREPVSCKIEFYLADTMGELGLFYRLAGIAFIGGSLVPRGGHNPFEAARLDCAVLHGPDMSNCSGMAMALRSAGASESVTDAETLAEAVSALLADPHLRSQRATAGLRASTDGLGVLDAVVARLAPWLDRLAPLRDAAELQRSLRA